MSSLGSTLAETTEKLIAHAQSMSRITLDAGDVITRASLTVAVVLTMQTVLMGGYVLIPTAWEFWQGRAHRLHDRFRYVPSEGGAWAIERLGP